MKKLKTIKVNETNLSNFFDSNEDDLEFEEMVINSDVMKVVRQLMKDNNNMTRDELAGKLDVSKAYISKLFTSDKYFNVNLLAKLQRVFSTSIKVVTSDMIKQYKSDNSIDARISEPTKIIEIGIVQLRPHNIGSESLVKDGTTQESKDNLMVVNY